MSSILQPFILVFLLSFSVCEKSRIKRAPQAQGQGIACLLCECPEPQPPTPPTCPVSPQELCSGAYYCASTNKCITTRFAARSVSDALDKCSSLSNENVTFRIANYPIGRVTRNLAKCLSVALPASGIDSNELYWGFDRYDFKRNQCYVFLIETDGKDRVFQTSHPGEVSCTEKHPFFCEGNFKR
ncbi:UNVERIFIED_CONTAM: hypothetical protein RMT77_013620 [Armadillidium vulgare]